MSKLQLPSVTLLCADCVSTQRAINVLEHCKSKADFGAVKFLTSLPTDYQHKVEIMPLNTLIAYSIFMLTKVNAYIDTPHVLVVQRDGFILNPESFNPAWLELDYIAPIFVQYDKVGSGGFSLRSKKLMDNVASNIMPWNGTQKQADQIQSTLGYYEDGMICLSNMFNQFKIANLEQASMFAQGGNRNPKYYVEKPFGFHGTWQEINHETGFVHPICEHEDGHCECRNNHRSFLKSLESE